MKANSWTRLLRAAEKTTCRYGFGSASIADMAKEARVPLAMSTIISELKDDFGGAIVEVRVSRFRKLWQRLDTANSPKKRLCALVDIKIKNREAWPAAAVLLEPCVPNCKTTGVQRLRNRGCCLRKPWLGWRTNFNCWAKESTLAVSPCIFYPRRKEYPCAFLILLSLTMSLVVRSPEAADLIRRRNSVWQAAESRTKTKANQRLG